MAGKATKSRKPSFLSTLYLRTYNLVQVLGWSYILCKLVRHNFSSTVEGELWQNVKLLLLVFQNAAVLEVIHAATGLVRSNPIVTAFQVASRVMVVCGVLLASPVNYAASSVGLPLCLLAWSLTEIIRYSYYFMSLIGFVPHILSWLRYTLFIVLYPLGVTGELLCIYAAAMYAKSHPEAYSYALPNAWNFTFSYYYALVIVMLLYVPGFPQLYLHMFTQRHKVLAKGDSQKKAQ